MARNKPRHMAPAKRSHRGVIVAGVVVLVVAVGAALWVLLSKGVLSIPSLPDTPTKEENVDKTADSSKDSKETDADSAQNAEAKQEADSDDADLAARFAAGNIHSVRLVGDSITAGYGTDGYEDANLTATGAVVYDNGGGLVRYETSEEAQCWANAFRSYATEHGVTSFVNAGINGAYMTELAANPKAWLADGADVVFVALGTNDAGYESVEEYEQAARTALEAADECSDVLVVISPVHDLRPADWLVSSTKELGDVLRSICEERGYVFVDAYEAVKPEQFCQDGLHPSTSGSLALWECIRDSLGL